MTNTSMKNISIMRIPQHGIRRGFVRVRLSEDQVKHSKKVESIYLNKEEIYHHNYKGKPKVYRILANYIISKLNNKEIWVTRDVKYTDGRKLYEVIYGYVDIDIKTVINNIIKSYKRREYIVEAIKCLRRILFNLEEKNTMKDKPTVLF